MLDNSMTVLVPGAFSLTLGCSHQCALKVDLTFTNMLQAIKEYSAIIDHLLLDITDSLSQSQTNLLDKALCQRASIYEHLEAYEASLQDICQLLKLQSCHILVSAGPTCVAVLLDHVGAGQGCGSSVAQAPEDNWYLHTILPVICPYFGESCIRPFMTCSSQNKIEQLRRREVHYVQAQQGACRLRRLTRRCQLQDLI